MADAPVRERKSHITTLLPNDLLDELDNYSKSERVKKAFVIETALLRFFASEKAKRTG
jgi:hypothetical protein